MKIINDRTFYDPQDCYFAVEEFEGLRYVLISDKETWHSEGYVNDSFGTHSFEEGVLPDDFTEVMEAVWETELSKDESKELLSNLGFTYSKELESEIYNYV